MAHPHEHRILIVEDDESVRLMLSTLLGLEPDFAVVGMAADGEQALELLEQLNPDAVLLDLTLPKMDGLEVARRMLDRSPGLRVVIHSGHAEDQRHETLAQQGVSAWVEKGTRVELLVDQLRELCVAARAASIAADTN